MKKIEKEKARELRQSGESVKVIAKNLKVSQGTVSAWVRDIVLSDEQVLNLLNRQEISRVKSGITRRVNTNKKRAEYKALGWELAKKSDDFRILCSLYWGEGDKKSNFFRLSNSDPYLIRTVVNWLLNNEYSRMTLTIGYYKENKISKDEIFNWWTTKLPKIDKIIIKERPVSRASQLKNVGKLPYGTGYIYAARSNELLFKVLGGIDFIAGKEKPASVV